ncbi:MAG: hypothetical protein AAGG38_07235 [Planctomycetota bacterium]
MADNTPTTFSPDAARRIASATRRIEAMPLRRGVTETRPRPVEDEIWAVLTGHNPLAPQAGYSWVQVTPNTGDGWAPMEGGARGIENATETSGKYPIPVPHVVRLRRGPDNPDTGDPRWTFVYDPDPELFASVPPHDHRDNFAGGFAFSVYHPGSALPQMPWAL